MKRFLNRMAIAFVLLLAASPADGAAPPTAPANLRDRAGQEVGEQGLVWKYAEVVVEWGFQKDTENRPFDGSIQVHAPAGRARHRHAAARRHADDHDRPAGLEIACGRPIAARHRRAGPLHAGGPRPGANDRDRPHHFRQFLLPAGGPGNGADPRAGIRILRLCHSTAESRRRRRSPRRRHTRSGLRPRSCSRRRSMPARGPRPSAAGGATQTPCIWAHRRHGARHAPERRHPGAAARHRRTPGAGLRHRGWLAKSAGRQGERQGPGRPRAPLGRQRRGVVDRPRCHSRPHRCWPAEPSTAAGRRPCLRRRTPTSWRPSPSSRAMCSRWWWAAAATTAAIRRPSS